jgi:preprotein translocase subunit SecD
MLNIPVWKRALSIIVVLLAFLMCLPSFLTAEQRGTVQSALPSWVPFEPVSLGLDLQGGSYMLLQADINSVIKDKAENNVSALRNQLRDDKIEVTSINQNLDKVIISMADNGTEDAIRNAVRMVDENLTVSQDGSELTAYYDEKALDTIRDQTMAQSIEIVSRRVNESGTKEPIIQRQGEDRILVQLPGINDPEYIKKLLGKTAKLTFHLVSDNEDGVGVRRVAMRDAPGQMLPVVRRPLMTGDMLVNAQPSFQEGAPVVSFRLNAVGARKFCSVTTENVGRPFAVILDNEVVTAPRINEPICGGSAVISGTFTVQESNDTAVLLRAGALPTTLTVVEERSVGPSLGSDSVDAGATAGVIAFVLIVSFMILSYGLFGVFASIALFVNMALIIALLAMIQATLTLPGIAGAILTMGLAVDANVLIFERMREEIRSGKSIISSMDIGFNKAMASIIDSNLTTFIACIILYAVGTGPIKGFAITSSIGVVTSMFSAIMLTRLMLVVWLKKTKPKTLPL